MSNYDKCEHCDGTGEVLVFRLLPSGHTEVWEECDACDGTGEIEEEK